MVLHRTVQLSYCLQLVRMLMVVVTLYTLSYFPLNIVWVSPSRPLVSFWSFALLNIALAFRDIICYMKTI